MAESVFGFALNILSNFASQAFDAACNRVLSSREARYDLAKLRETIETIQAMLVDAERKQAKSEAVKDLNKRLKGVLYDADDLFDEVVTHDRLKQHMMKGSNGHSLKRKAGELFSGLKQEDSIAEKIKVIRKSLGEISADMAIMGCVSCAKEEETLSCMSSRQDPGCFVDAEDVIGRDEDKKAIVKLLFTELDDPKQNVPIIIAIVGIGGMGKTTLAQLIYNDEEVERNFEKRWFACISDISDEKQVPNEKEVLGKIFQSISEKSYSDFTVGQLQNKIRKSIKGKKFLLVLDDVWDENHDRWLKRWKLLNCGAKGSRIIVTTRSSSVVTAIDALETHELAGLSEDESWNLFKRLAFAPGTENDPRRIDLGRGIVKKCKNVPLAIRSIGSLLFEKNTIQEWELIRDVELPNLGQSHEDGIMPVLKLSYDYLQSNLKQCFAYCSLFPKDYEFDKQELIYLWIAQGYIGQNNEDAGHSDFMHLLRRGFFQEVKYQPEEFKMHDLIHDLAQHVAGEESIMLPASSNISNYARHVSVGDFKIDESWAIPTSLLSVKKLRSCLFFNGGSIQKLRSFLFRKQGSTCSPILIDQLFANFKRLRSLRLVKLGIENVSDSIGELKHLRYLNLSGNRFESLPDSVTNLLNLLTLDIQECSKLKALPGDFRKLINLRCLNIKQCYSLKHMPAGIGELSCLQYLSHFKVGRRSIEDKEIKVSGLDQLARLEQLRGNLWIEFEDGISDWDGDECWQLPAISQEILTINNYPGRRISRWGINGRANNLVFLELRYCKNVKYLPPLRYLPHLRHLFLHKLEELEYVEDGDSCTTEVLGSSSFFPRLEWLELLFLPKLKGWWSEVATSSSMFLSFLLLEHLHIADCPQLKSIPLCPVLETLILAGMGDNMVIQQLLSNNSNTSPASPTTQSFQQIFDSPFLQTIEISHCHTLEVIYLTSPKLQRIEIVLCQRLKKMHIAHPNILEVLYIIDCLELELGRGVDWDSLSNLRLLEVHPLPPPEKLPECLRHRQSLGQLKITQYYD